MDDEDHHDDSVNKSGSCPGCHASAKVEASRVGLSFLFELPRSTFDITTLLTTMSKRAASDLPHDAEARDGSSSSSSSSSGGAAIAPGSTTLKGPSSASASSSPLYKFFRKELIKYMAYDALIPFLTTNDLLRLFECSKTLVPYRQHLSRIKLVSHPSRVTPASRRALSQLLAGQQRDIEMFLRTSASMLSTLGYGGCYGCSKVKSLRIEVTNGGQEVGVDAVSLALGLLGGNFLRLEELTLSYGVDCNGLKLVLWALQEGPCPGLRSSNLPIYQKPGEVGDAIASCLNRDIASSWRNCSFM